MANVGVLSLNFKRNFKMLCVMQQKLEMLRRLIYPLVSDFTSGQWRVSDGLSC